MIKSLLAALFGSFMPRSIIGFGPAKRTVDGALVHFNRALEELKAVEQQENAEAERAEQELAEAAAKLEASRREAARARSKQAKIAAWIGNEDEPEDTIETLRGVQFEPAAR